MFVTKEEFKNLDLYKVFFEDGVKWVHITDGRHTINNVAGELLVSKHHSLTFETRAPKYISKKINEANEKQDAAKAEEIEATQETQETQETEEPKMNDLLRQALKKLVKLHKSNKSAAYQLAVKLQPRLHEFFVNDVGYNNYDFIIDVTNNPERLEELLRIA